MFTCLRAYVKHKLEPHFIPCAFLGYSSQHRGYLCLDLSNGKIFTDKHVQFHELSFPFLHKKSLDQVSTFRHDLVIHLWTIPITSLQPLTLDPVISSSPIPQSPNPLLASLNPLQSLALVTDTSPSPAASPIRDHSPIVTPV